MMVTVKLVRVIPVIPTTSIFQIWEGIRDKFNVVELDLRVRKQNPVEHIQINPFIKMDRRQDSDDLMCNYKKKLHGDFSLGDLCALIQGQGFADALIKQIVMADNGLYYTFKNAKAPMALKGYVSKIRRKYLKAHGIPPRPTYMFPRILRLSIARNKREQLSSKTKRPYVDPYNLFTDKTFNHLQNKYGHLFCKIMETDVEGTVIRTKVEGVEETVWW